MKHIIQKIYKKSIKNNKLLTPQEKKNNYVTIINLVAIYAYSPAPEPQLEVNTPALEPFPLPAPAVVNLK